MNRSRETLKRLITIAAWATLAAFVLFQVFRAALSPYIAGLSDATIEPWLAYAVCLPLGFSWVWIMYQSAQRFVRYSASELNALQHQMWGLLAFVLVSSVGVVFSGPRGGIPPGYFYVTGSLCLAYSAIHGIRNRVSVISISGRHHKGWVASLVNWLMLLAAALEFSLGVSLL